MKKTFSLILTLSAITAIAFIAWCNKQNTVEVGDKISISYTATFTDGTAFQTKSLDFIVGNSEVITWLDKGVLGLKLNDTKTITIEAKDGYAKEYKPSMVQKISKTIFDKLHIEPKQWEKVKLGEMEWVIKWSETDKKGYESVLFDTNSRETYETLIYEVKIEKIEKK